MNTANSERDFNRMSFYGPQKDGIIVGSLWSIGFLTFMASLSVSILTLPAMALYIVAIYVIQAKSFKHFKTYGADKFTALADFRYMANICFFSAIIYTLVIFVYFQFVDNGYMVRAINHNFDLFLSDPAMKAQAETANGKETIQALEKIMSTATSTLEGLSPVKIAYNFAVSILMQHIIICIPLCIIHYFRRNKLKD